MRVCREDRHQNMRASAAWKNQKKEEEMWEVGVRTFNEMKSRPLRAATLISLMSVFIRERCILDFGPFGVGQWSWVNEAPSLELLEKNNQKVEAKNPKALGFCLVALISKIQQTPNENSRRLWQIVATKHHSPTLHILTQLMISLNNYEEPDGQVPDRDFYYTSFDLIVWIITIIFVPELCSQHIIKSCERSPKTDKFPRCYLRLE